ncbi:unnamed protein product [Nezara viridula]|uniref:Uncharacterized protein n=1 Tax=Nezara viridula TaxID=85310 RepID=A0A9P0MSN5_NEZVI|nr:unnamed protein product [Nezara viridula]
MPFPVLPWIFLTILLKETACHSGRSRNGKNAMPGKITVSVETKQKICTTVHANLGRAAAVKYRGHQSTFCTAPNCKTPHESSVGPVILHVCQDSVTDQLLEMGPEDSITNLDYSNISVAGNLRPLLSDLQTIINYIDASLSHINRPDLNKAKIERGFNKLVMNLANTLKGLKIIDPIQFQKSVLQIVHGMKQKSPSKDRKGKDVKGLTNNILSSLQRLNQVILGITSKKNFKQTGVYRQPGVSTKSVKIDTRKNRIPTPVTKPTLTDEVFPDTEKQHITIISGLGSPENLEEKLGQLTQKIPSTPTGSDLSQLDNELNLLIKKIAALNGPGTLFHPINLRSDIKKLKTVSGDAGSRPNKGTLDHDSITDRLLSLVKKLNFITNELGKLLAMKKTGRPGYQPEPNMPMGGSSTPSSGGRPGYQPEPNMPMGGNHIPSSGGRPGYKQEPNKPVGGSSTPSSGGRPGYQPGPNMPMGGKHSPSIGGRPGYQQEPNMPMGGNHIPSSGGRPGYKQEPTKPVGGISTKSSGGRPGYKQEPNKPVGGSSTPSSGGRPGYKQEPNKPVGGISTPSSGGRPGYQQEPNIPMGGSSTPSSGGRPGYQQEPNMHMGGDNIPSNRSRPGYQQEPNMHMGGDYIPSNRSRPGYQQEPNMTMEGSYTPSSGGRPGYQQEPNMPMGESYTPSSGGRPEYQQEPNMPMGGDYIPSNGSSPGYQQEPNMPMGPRYTSSSGGRPGYQQEPYMPRGENYTPSGLGYSRREHEPNMPTRANHIRPSGDSVEPGYQNDDKIIMEDSSPDISMDENSFLPSKRGYCTYHELPIQPSKKKHFLRRGGGMKVRQHTLDPVTKNMISTLHQMETIVQGLIDLQRMFASSRPGYQPEPNMPTGGNHSPSSGDRPGYQQEPNMPTGGNHIPSSGDRPGYQQEPNMPTGGNHIPSSGETSEATKNPSRNHQADIAAIMHRIQTSFRHFNETYHDLAKHQKPNQDGSHPPEIHHENTDENKPHEAEAEIKEVPEVHFDNINETIPDDNENVEILINQLLETDSDNPAINEEHGSDVHINETVTDQPVPQSFDRETVGRRINNTMESLNQMIVDLSALQVLNKGDSVRPEHSSVNEKGPNKQQIVELTKNIHSTLKYLSKILDDLQILQTTETQGVPGERYHNLEGEVEELSKHLVTGPDAGQHSVGSDTSKILSTLQESVTDTELREIIREYTIVVERFKIYGYEYLHHTEENKEHPEDEPPVADDFYKMKYPVVEQEHRIESLIKILESDEIIESFWKPEYGNTTGIKEAQTTLEQILSQSVKAAENQMGYHKIAKLICVILRLQEKELLAFDLMPYILYFYWILDMNNNESMKFGSSYLQRPDLVLPKGEKPIDTLIMTIKSPLFKEVFWDPEYGGTEKMESIIATFTETFLNGKQGVQSTNDLIKTMCILITLLDTGLVNLTQVEIDSLFKYLFPILDSLILKGHHYVPDSYLKKVDEEHKGYYSDYFVDKLKAAHHTEQQ